MSGIRNRFYITLFMPLLFLTLLIAPANSQTASGAATPPAAALVSAMAMDALKQDLISLEMSGEKTMVRITARRSTNDKSEMKLTLPEGVTKLGFIDQNKISGRGTGSTSVISPQGAQITLNEVVGTNDFAGNGFSLVLANETTLVLPEGKDEVTLVAEGSLNVSVPSGFTGFALSGFEGRITEGTIKIGKSSFYREDKPDSRRYRLTFSNMTITK